MPTHQSLGGTPVAVVSSPERAALVRGMGVEHVIDRAAEGYRFWKDDQTQDPAEALDHRDTAAAG